MTNKVKLAIAIAIFFWASAFVGIRAGLVDYSPGSLALLRYLVASFCLAIVYFARPHKNIIPWRHRFALLAVGVVGIGFYNINLNYGEISVSSGMASFIVSQSPILTTIFAVIFLGERLNLFRLLGFTVSALGVMLIARGELGGFHWTMGMTFMLLATISGAVFTILQKPFLKNYNPIEATTYAIWGGTLFLCLFAPQLYKEFPQASLSATLTVVYLGIFPAAIGYIAWSYVLSQISASRAVSFIYFSPFISTILGWLWLGEVPALVALFGGALAIVGVWLVNHSYKKISY